LLCRSPQIRPKTLKTGAGDGLKPHAASPFTEDAACMAERCCQPSANAELQPAFFAPALRCGFAGAGARVLATAEPALAGLLRGVPAFAAFTVLAAAGLAVLLRGFLTVAVLPAADFAAAFLAAGLAGFFAGDSGGVSAAASAACAAALAFSCAVT
jgi:hypothetical protein